MVKQPPRNRWVTGIGAGLVAAALSIGVVPAPAVWLGLIGAGWLGYGIATRT